MKTFSLGSLEKKVLEFLWDKDGCELKDVWMYFYKKKGLAYTTVATVLQRLSAKGLVKKTERVYIPRYSKQVFSFNLLKNFLELFFKDFGETAYTSFIEGVEKLDLEKRRKLLEKLEQALKDEK